MTPLSYTNPADGLSLHGTITDVANPKAVLSIVHGFGEHGGRYKPMAEFLAGHGIATLTIDLHGHGETKGKRGVVADYDLMRDDVAALLGEAQSRFPSVPQFLYGHSMGGGLVINYGLNRNVDALRGIIATAPLLTLPAPPPNFVLGLGNFVTKLLPNLAIGQPIKGDVVSTLPDVQKAYENDPLNHGTLGLKLAYGMIMQGRENIRHAAQFPKPLLLMHSKDDQLTSFDGSAAFAGSAQECRFVPYEGVEHEIHNDSCRDDVYGQIKDFIESLI